MCYMVVNSIVNPNPLKIITKVKWTQVCVEVVPIWYNFDLLLYNGWYKSMFYLNLIPYFI